MKFIGRRMFDGFLLLLPLILSYILIGSLFDLVMGLTIPITDLLPGRLFSNEWEQRFAAAAILLVLCFLIGLADQTETFRRGGDWLERRILGRFAPYSMLRSFSSRLSATDVPDKLQPAFVDNGNVRQLAFIVEEHGNGDVTLFVPLASTPGVGQVQVVRAENVEKLDVTVMEALGPLFNWGDGTKALVARVKKR
jgi:uncharacterized membrane protein